MLLCLFFKGTGIHLLSLIKDKTFGLKLSKTTSMFIGVEILREAEDFSSVLTYN